jgi:hypothetical protein
MADCRDLWGAILGRQLLEPTRHAVEKFAERDARNSPFAPLCMYKGSLNDY